ncbi:MAG TPA: hypothetical protein VMT72_04315 [Pseudolabrys sp.]|nr:hypothetical protein [Pseudolabrys sp.]
MVDLIDVAIRKTKLQNEKVLAAAKKRYDRFQKLAENPKSTKTQVQVAERNMKIVLVTLEQSQASYRKTMEKLEKLR